MAKARPTPVTTADRLVLKHALAGWGGLCVFLSLGILLEAMHGLKLDLYLDVRQETRRFMWTLAHAHGTLFSLLQLGFAWTVTFSSRWVEAPMREFQSASRAFIAALVLMPLGFFLGGMWTYGGDPGLGIFLVPVGALFLLFGCLRVLLVVVALRRGK